MADSREHLITALTTAQLPSHAAVETQHIEVTLRTQYLVFPAMLLLSLLTGCGNANQGKAFTPYKRGLTASSQTTNSENSSVISLSYCKNFVGQNGSNGGSADMLNGASVCKVTNNPTMVVIKVSANFPINGRFCVVPMNDMPFRESCFSINGQATVSLDPLVQSLGFGSMALIAESDMTAYRSFLNMQTNVSPARGIAFMNQ